MTAQNYRKAAQYLNEAGWVCTGGMYPNSNAEEHAQVTWVAHFERSNGQGKRPDCFWLTSQTLGSPEYAEAINGVKVSKGEMENYRNDIAARNPALYHEIEGGKDVSGCDV